MGGGASPAALVYALEGRASAIVAPDTIAEFRAIGNELRDMAERNGDIERLVSAYFYRLIAAVTVADIDGARLDLQAMSDAADELRQPAQPGRFARCLPTWR